MGRVKERHYERHAEARHGKGTRDGPRPLKTADLGKMAPVKGRRYERLVEAKHGKVARDGPRPLHKTNTGQDGARKGTPLREARGKRRPTGKPDTWGTRFFFQNTPGVGIPDGSAGNGGGL